MSPLLQQSLAVIAYDCIYRVPCSVHKSMVDDPTYKYDPPFTEVFTDKVIHSKLAKRSTPNLISATRRLLSHALLHDPSNSMFALLSPSCIHLHSFNFTYRILTNSGKSFIEILDIEGGAYDRWAARGEESMLPEVGFKDFRIGSQFWVLTRKHARMVVRDIRIWPKFNQTCLREDTCYPEEHYFPTLAGPARVNFCHTNKC
ncbi:hypothetical protein NC651_017218 [Populus alba x Populus x berolinensis]|nr:hypothetical protein NC651_017218 [Populus alba x Populus x berolinensis]